jgi:hypothetical protein
MPSATWFLVFVCISFSAIVMSLIFTRPFARWLRQHSR